MDLEDDVHQDRATITFDDAFVANLAKAVYTHMVNHGHFAKLIKEEVDEVVDNLPSQVFNSLEDNIEQLIINSGTWDNLIEEATSNCEETCENMLQDCENKITDNCIQYIRDNISVEIDI